jgi:drug/metabolite transporter (DMT)-like permease
MLGPFFAILAAVLFGLSSPLAKLLMGSMSPWLLAGVLYLGSGIGMAIMHTIRLGFGSKAAHQRILLSELPWLLGVIVSGGILGPVLLMYGLSMIHASTGSLLLNLEGVFTASLAWMLFREHYDKRIVFGMISIIAGGIVLTWSNAISWSGLIGPALIAGACLSWGVDNNLTRKISLNDPILVTMIKSLAAGTTNLIIALFLGATLPATNVLAMAAALGFFSYGLSIVCFILALRYLGASRTGAYFSSAPFVGSILGLMIFKEPVTVQLASAAILMGFGIYLHLTELHEHEHLHLELSHEHSHVHDEHHQHQHSPSDPSGEPHTHHHRHEALKHKHPHFPDMHHTHSH